MKRLALLALLLAAQPASAAVISPTGGSVLDRSGTITTAGASQQVAPLFQDRIYAFCQNPITATETLFVNFNFPATTTGGSFELAPGGSLSFAGVFVPNGAINVTAATAGHRFICKVG